MTALFQSIKLSDAPRSRGVFMRSAKEWFVEIDIKNAWINIKSFWPLREGQCLSSRGICPRIFFESIPKWRKNAKASALPECKAAGNHWKQGGSESGHRRNTIAREKLGLARSLPGIPEGRGMKEFLTKKRPGKEAKGPRTHHGWHQQ